MKTAVLITRTVDCSKLTKEHFVAMMMEDLKNSVIKSEEIFRPELEAQFYHNQEQHREYVVKQKKTLNDVSSILRIMYISKQPRVGNWLRKETHVQRYS